MQPDSRVAALDGAHRLSSVQRDEARAERDRFGAVIELIRSVSPLGEKLISRALRIVDEAIEQADRDLSRPPAYWHDKLRNCWHAGAGSYTCTCDSYPMTLLRKHLQGRQEELFSRARRWQDDAT